MGVKTKHQAKSLNPCVRARRQAWRAAPLAAVLASAWIAVPAAAKSDSTATAFDYKSWDAYAGGADSSQYSSLDQVNTGNVKDLQVAWTFETGPGQAPHFNPIKIGDTLYLIAGSKLVALDRSRAGRSGTRTTADASATGA